MKMRATVSLLLAGLTLVACNGEAEAEGTPLGETHAVTYNGVPLEITLDTIECGLPEATKETKVIVFGSPNDKVETETFEAGPDSQYCRYDVTAVNQGDQPVWAPYITQAVVDSKTYDNQDTNDLNAVTDGLPPWEHLQPGQAATITQWIQLPEGEVTALIYPAGDDQKTARLLTK